MIHTMLTTVDNPYSPFDDFDTWLSFDMAHGYNTSGLLARIANTSDDLSDIDYEVELANAIDEIVSENVSGIYRKVIKEY